MSQHHAARESSTPSEAIWDAFELDDLSEPEPEYGDFWGELDDDYDIGVG